MSLNLSKLENPKRIGDKTTYRCPACKEKGQDKSGEHLVVYPDGKYGCIMHPQDSEHNKIIYALAGEQNDNIPYQKQIQQPKPTTNKKTHLTVDNAIQALAWATSAQKGIEYHYVGKWAYKNAQSEIYAYMIRFEPLNEPEKKTYRPIHKVDGGWQTGGIETWFLYNLPDILQSPTEPVFICEGEKACSAGKAIGLICTTSSHGAKSSNKTDWTPLSGRTVYILPDNDSAGVAYAKEVKKILSELNHIPSIKIINLPNLPESGDLYDFVEARDAQDVEVIKAEILNLISIPEILEPPKQETSTEEFYYEKYSKEYLLRNQRKSWLSLTETQFKKELAYRGLSSKAEKGENVSEIDEFLIKLRDTRDIDYAAPLAGYKSGFYEISGNRILVTTSPTIIKPEYGEWKTLETLIKGLFTDEVKNQIPYLFSWIKIAHESLSTSKLRPGQALVLCGPKNAGKSLLQKIITEILGGREAKPFQYMTGATEFNGSLFRAEHLFIEDEPTNTDLRVRRAFGNQIKQFTGSDTQNCHAKHKEAITLTPFWRLTISLNIEPENLMVLPPIDDSIEDKLIIFKTHLSDMLMTTESTEDRVKFWNTLKSEIPAFLYYLANWKIPDELRFPEIEARRYGFKNFHHPEVLREIDALSPEYRLLNIIDKEIFGIEIPMTWSGTAEDLEVRLTSQGDMQHESRKLLSWGNAAGTYLSRLAKKYPDRFVQKRTNSSRTWQIEPPCQEWQKGDA